MNVAEQAKAVVAATLEGAPFHIAQSDLTLAEAFDVQDKAAEGLARARGGLAGYKIAWNAPHLMKAFDMPHPGLGRVFADQLHRGSAQVALADYRGLFIEAEIAATLGADLEPGQRYDAVSVRGAIAGFCASFEILDRFGAPATARAPEILAHNIFNAGAIMAQTSVAPADLDVKTIETRVVDDGRVVAEGTGMAPQDPFEAIAFLANHFTGRGHTMRASEMILCGSHIPLYAVAAPTRIDISMSGLGEVSLNVSGSE